MVKTLNLWNFPAAVSLEGLVSGKSFILKTCQRTLVVSYEARPFSSNALDLHEKAEGPAAYMYLLETICGLKSKLIGENEIVGQFKTAYQDFASAGDRDSRLMLVLEKLFKDAKEIRTEHLIGIGQKTYAGLTRKHFAGKMKGSPILILGSGQLAEDLINQFKKHHPILISARNTARAQELCDQHGCKLVPWDDRVTWENSPFIANTVGFEGVLLNETFFESWSLRHAQRLCVDLGSPSALVSELTAEEGLIRLDHLLLEGALMEDQKNARIALAREALLNLVDRRISWLEEKGRKWQTAQGLHLVPGPVTA